MHHSSCAPNSGRRRALWCAAFAAALMAVLPQSVVCQEAPLDWSLSANFRYNILSTTYNPTSRTVTVVFSVTNPATGAAYDIKASPSFIAPAARVGIDVAWNTAGWRTTELVNTGSSAASIARTWMNTTPPGPGGIGPAYPRTIDALRSAQACNTSGSPCANSGALAYFVTAILPAQAVGSGRVGIEGHAVNQTGLNPATGAPVYSNIPIKSVVQDFAIDATAVPRRQIVQIDKCKGCHDGKVHGDTTVPRLSLHGGNRTEEPGLCVVCHNPNQTDAAYRSSGSEESVDFKRLVHGIHAGGFRRTPLVIVGFKGAVNDFSSVRFPKDLKDCTLCHLDANGKGTFELSSNGSLLGSTINSGSTLAIPGSVDVDPTPDLKISPIAAACSACHDSSEVRRHMVSNGASFAATQATLAGKERCINCHGPGKEKSVRRVHEIGTSGYSH